MPITTMSALSFANTTLHTLPVVNISVPALTHTATTSPLPTPANLIPHFTVAPHIPYPHYITDIPRPSLSPQDLNAAAAAKDADAAFPVLGRSQPTEYRGHPVTWITSTQTIFDTDRDWIPDEWTRPFSARDVAAETDTGARAVVNTMVNSGDDDTATATTETKGANTSDLLDRPASAVSEFYRTKSYHNPRFPYSNSYPNSYPYPEIMTAAGPMFPNTFVTVTRSAPKHVNAIVPRDVAVPTKTDLTITAVAWTTFWVPGPDSTRTQEGTVTLETGLVVPTTEVNGQPVVTLEVEGMGFRGE